MSENRKFVGSFTVLLGILVLASMGLYFLIDALSQRGFGNIVSSMDRAELIVTQTSPV